MFGETASCEVAALNLSAVDTYKYPSEVKYQIDQNSKDDFRKLAIKLNRDPNTLVTIIQHEYGIMGGEEGENILSFTKIYKKALIVALHTVIPTPSPKMQTVSNEIIERADKVVLPTENSRLTIEKLYPKSVGKIVVVPHGIHHTSFSSTTKPKQKLKLDNRLVLSTFGLLSRGKGIEYVISALPEVVRKFPSLLYLVLGETHPVIRRSEGEKYRLELVALVTKLKLNKHVRFIDNYLELPDLLNFLKATDIYISTSTNPDQAVSGTLSYALGTGRAVISTSFAQAKEIITPNVGRVVPIRDSKALQEEILSLLSNPKELSKMNRYAYEITRPMLWSNVALEFSKIIFEISPKLYPQGSLPPINLTHLDNMTDNCGLFQFANFQTPNKEYGYTLDDNARALVVACKLQAKDPDEYTLSRIEKYLNFIGRCQLADGTFTNYISYKEKESTVQNQNEDIEESLARALWGLCTVIEAPNITSALKSRALDIFNLALPHTDKLAHMRAEALTIKALSLVIGINDVDQEIIIKIIRKHADSLINSFEKSKRKDWEWFDNYLSYNNAILPEGLYCAYLATQKEQYKSVAEKSLSFLISKTFTTSMYVPIGSKFWHIKDQERSKFDQQPEDPASMILALSIAYKITHNEEYRELAETCFSWFTGNNSLRMPVYNSLNGGCFDGLHTDRVNLNQGAESLVSYLLARIEIEVVQTLMKKLPSKSSTRWRK